MLIANLTSSHTLARVSPPPVPLSSRAVNGNANKLRKGLAPFASGGVYQVDAQAPSPIFAGQTRALWLFARAGVAKLVDASDLDSDGQPVTRLPCGFESHRQHHMDPSFNGQDASPLR